MTGIDWYTARAAGVIAYALLSGGVLLGVLLAGRARLPRWPAFVVTDVHRFVPVEKERPHVEDDEDSRQQRNVHTSLVAVLVPLAVWAAATAHGIGAGTDATAEWLRLLYVVAIGSVAAACAWRLNSSPAPARCAPS